VVVTCSYPGANAQVVADTVAAPIEQQVNGVENMMYMSSQANNDGSYQLTVTFKLGIDLDAAQVQVQNRIAQATPILPDVVKAIGVVVKKQSPSFLLVVNLYSELNHQTGQPYFNQLYVSNFATIQVKDALARVDGVGDVMQFGQQDYSMRVWLDPERLSSRNLTAGDVIRVLKEQNCPALDEPSLRRPSMLLKIKPAGTGGWPICGRDLHVLLLQYPNDVARGQVA